MWRVSEFCFCIVPDGTHSYRHTALSEISNRFVGKILLLTICYYALIFFGCCCLVYGVETKYGVPPVQGQCFFADVCILNLSHCHVMGIFKYVCKWCLCLYYTNTTAWPDIILHQVAFCIGLWFKQYLFRDNWETLQVLYKSRLSWALLACCVAGKEGGGGGVECLSLMLLSLSSRL